MESIKISKKMINDLESYGFVCPNGETLYGCAAVSKYEYTYINDSPLAAAIGFGHAYSNQIVKGYGDLTLPEFKRLVSDGMMQ